MTKKAALLTFVGLVAVFALAVDLAEAQNREARPGQQPRRNVPAISKAGGLTCAAATVASPSGAVFNFNDAGNSCTGANNISDYNNAGSGGDCNTLLYPGPELIYQFTVGTGNNVTATLDPAAADMGVFILSDCPNGLSCVGFQDTIGGGAVSQVAPGSNGLTPGTYWVYVDSYYSTGALSCGSYTFTLTGSVPVDLIDFKVE